jgi:hypothetical protein
LRAAATAFRAATMRPAERTLALLGWPIAEPDGDGGGASAVEVIGGGRLVGPERRTKPRSQPAEKSVRPVWPSQRTAPPARYSRPIGRRRPSGKRRSGPLQPSDNCVRKCTARRPPRHPRSAVRPRAEGTRRRPNKSVRVPRRVPAECPRKARLHGNARGITPLSRQRGPLGNGPYRHVR